MKQLFAFLLLWFVMASGCASESSQGKAETSLVEGLGAAEPVIEQEGEPREEKSQVAEQQPQRASPAEHGVANSELENEFRIVSGEIDYWVGRSSGIGPEHAAGIEERLDSLEEQGFDAVRVGEYRSRLLTISPVQEEPRGVNVTKTGAVGGEIVEPPVHVDGTGLGLSLPDGYKISYFTRTGLGPLRLMAFSPDGILFVTKPSDSGLYSDNRQGGEVLAFPDNDNDGNADDTIRVITGFSNRPHGIAFNNGYLYIAEENLVTRYEYLGNGEVGKREVVVSLPTGNEHVSRTIGFSPSGKMFVSVGSSCNVCKEPRRQNAAILEFNSDGSGEKVFAEGLRNAVGFVFHPSTGEMWATENGRDYLGEDLPPDEINIVKSGRHYGWPYCYGGNSVDPEFNDTQFCMTAEPSLWDMQAHSAPLGLRFVEGKQFSDWTGDLLVAFHGSWNRQVPTGYKVVRLDVEGGTIVGEEDFITGWLKGGSASGRPVDVIFGSEGALYVSDDKLGVIYRVTRASGETIGTTSLSLSSPAFEHNTIIPSKYTCDGEEVSPSLSLSGVPEAAESLVLIMDDPDAVDVVGFVWDHWIVFDIPPSTTSIREGGQIGMFGLNGSGGVGYEGSCPPEGREHAYSFRLYALDKSLGLPEGASKSEVVQAMEGSVLAEAGLVGRYAR